MRCIILLLIVAMVVPLAGCRSGGQSHRELFWRYTADMDLAGRAPIGSTREAIHETLGSNQPIVPDEVEPGSSVAIWLTMVEQYTGNDVATVEHGLDIALSGYWSYRFYMNWIFYDRNDRVLWALREYIRD